MRDNFIFSGLGQALGKYQISNDDIAEQLELGNLKGLDINRVEKGKGFIKMKAAHPSLTPFDYMAEVKMGFKTRYCVVPFPPRIESYKKEESALDLLTKAMKEAFQDAQIDPEEIGLWLVSSATPHEMAPGIAETAKCFFTGKENSRVAQTTTSACVGFNVNIEMAINYFKADTTLKHIIVAHTELLSSLMVKTDDFVPFTTFSDGAAAVIISRVQGEEPEGVLNVVNYEDIQMIDFLGSDRDGNLIMDPRRVKDRAIPNIAQITRELMEKEQWSEEEVSLLIPHQTGNAIVHGAAEELQFPLSKVFQEVQVAYGNLSGASIPASFYFLNREKRLTPGMRLVTSVTGLGGELGGFSYVVPKEKVVVDYRLPLTGKVAMITGATGSLGSEVALQIARKGGSLLLHYNGNEKKKSALSQQLENIGAAYQFFKADFSSVEAVDRLIAAVLAHTPSIHFLIHTAAITGSLQKGSEVSSEEVSRVQTVNYMNAKRLTEGVKTLLVDTVLFTGSIAQDAMFPGSSSYVASKRALAGYAASLAKQLYPKVKTVLYIPAIIDTGMMDKLDSAQIKATMMSVGQEQLVKIEEIADRMINALRAKKVVGARNESSEELCIVKDGYKDF